MFEIEDILKMNYSECMKFEGIIWDNLSDIEQQIVEDCIEEIQNTIQFIDNYELKNLLYRISRIYNVDKIEDVYTYMLIWTQIEHLCSNSKGDTL
jgi:hypothetical protein